MADFEAPSFSLGLDLDFDQPVPPPPHSKQSPEPTIDVISCQSKEDDDQDFHPHTLISDIQAEDSPSPPPILKRLKRALPTRPSTVKRPRPLKLIDDEIEDISPPEDNHRGLEGFSGEAMGRVVGVSNKPDYHSALQKHSACSSSKVPLHGYAPLSTQFATKSKAKESTQASKASTFTSMEKSSSKTMFPKLTISPLRRFQLLDSDSDDPSSSEDIFEDAKKIDAFATEGQRNANQNLTVNQQKRDKVTGSKLETEDLWKDFGPSKSINIPTPALDEFCEEYFRSAKDKNVDQTKEEDVYVISSKVCDQKNSISGNAELCKNLHDPLPPAYKYFYHDDPKIQRLVRHRLHNFFPLGVNNTETPQSQHADIDYMCQFSQKEPTSRNQGLEGNSRTGRKNLKQSNCNNISEVSGTWVNPKGGTSTSKNAGKSQGRAVGRSSGGPKNAGKRRVRAVGQSSGSWFTGEDGRKVYVTKNGLELTGQVAYRHYRKESGTGFKKSRKKAASKKKSKR